LSREKKYGGEMPKIKTKFKKSYTKYHQEYFQKNKQKCYAALKRWKLKQKIFSPTILSTTDDKK